MKFLKWLIIVIVAIIAIALIVAFFGPSSYRVERSQEFSANKSDIQKWIVDLKKWDAWSPWKAMDSAAVYTYNDVVGVDASMTWKGEEVGEGSLKITNVSDTIITYQLDFIEPFASSSTGGFIFKSNDENTIVTWFDEGKNSYPMGRFFALFMNFDEMLGGDFEKGLSALKTAMENQKWEYTYNVLEKTVESFDIAAIRDTVSMEDAGTVMGENYGEINALLGKQKIKVIGAPIAISNAWEPTRWDFVAAIPVEKAGKNDGRVEFKKSYAGNVAYVVYTGPYEKTEKAYLDLQNYLKDKGLTENGGPWEVYLTDPTTEPDPSKWITEIYFPVK